MKNRANKKLVVGAIFLWALAQAINFDTRFESNVAGQVDKARVYIKQQPFHNNDQSYGTVEFTNGIAIYPDSTTGNSSITLGVTPPIGGSIRDASPFGSNIQITTSYDLILSNTIFEGKGFLKTIDFFITPHPYQIFLTRNVTVPDFYELAFGSDSGGILNGLGNSITIPSSVNTFLGIGTGLPDGFTVKDLNIIGSPGSDFHLDTVGLGLLTFENVQLSIFSNVSQYFDHSNLIYRGQNNVVGDGGYIQYSSNPFQSLFVTLESQTRVTVVPNTTMALVKAPPAIGFGNNPIFYLNFTDQTSELFLDNCTLQIGGDGRPFGVGPLTTNLTFTRGTMFINGNIALAAGAPGSSLQIGDGIDQANNFKIIILPGSKLIIEEGMTLINANV